MTRFDLLEPRPKQGSFDYFRRFAMIRMSVREGIRQNSLRLVLTNLLNHCQYMLLIILKIDILEP
ncbi:hypothetical protein BFP72_05350 [Reichenbachiella sp. 5M10]|nr:hypothetical protein BFP72_05350 [Reichenbachiella sp. 5M10]